MRAIRPKEATMTNQDKLNILLGIYNALFKSKAEGTDIESVGLITNMGKFMGRWFVNRTLRGFDIDINLGDRIIELRCLEQNPNKTDDNGNLKTFANLARKGHKIMWVINRKGSWLGHMQDGIWTPANDPVTKPATYVKVQPPAELNAGVTVTEASVDPVKAYQEHLTTGVVNLEELPDIPTDRDLADYVYESVAEMDEPPDWGDQ